MKIALVNDSFIEGRGADQVVYELAKRLGRSNEVDVITVESNFPEDGFRVKKIEAQRLLTGTWRDFLFFKTVRHFRKAAYNYDIINLHHATLAPAFHGFKNVVVTYHGSPFQIMGEKGFRKFARKFVNELGLRFTKKNKKTIAISEYIKRELIKNKFHSEKISVIYDGVGEEFIPTKEDNDYMFFVGRHYKHKNIEELINLSQKLGFKLKIAGDGPETKNLKKLAKEILAPVEFLGMIDRKALLIYYQKCSFFISSSYWEGFGLIFLEAARCAKPSIAYRQGSIPELVKHDKTGFLADSPQEFRRYAKILIENRDLRKRLGKEALKESQKFDWQETTDDYIALFKQVIKD